MKTTKTYSIDESLYSAFDLLATEKNINKSSFIEDLIKKYLKDNDMDFIDRVYESKFIPDSIVKVLTQDSTYYMLDDGSKIQKILFLQNFREIKGIEPEDFFKKSELSLANSLAKQIKNIETSELKDDSYKKPVITINEEQQCFDIRKGDDSEKDLYIVENNFKTKEYLKYDKTKICETIIKLKLMQFELKPTCEVLREVLIEVFTNHKDTMK